MNPSYTDIHKTAYELIPAAIRLPDINNEFRVSVQITALDALSMARYLADRAEPRFYEALEPIRTMERLGLIDPAAATQWAGEAQARFDAALRKTLYSTEASA